MSELTIDDILRNANKNKEVQSIKTASKKAGRKPLDPEKRMDQRVILYFSKKQLEEIEEAANRFDKKLGTFIKDTFYEAFNESKSKIEEIDKFIDSLNEEEIGELIKKYLMAKK